MSLIKLEENDSIRSKDNSKAPGSSSDPKVLRDDPLFSGKGAPAFMSPSEPAISLLRERYKESFAFVNGTEHRVHLFLIKVGLWSLVWTFIFKEIVQEDRYSMLRASLDRTHAALTGKEPTLLDDLDNAIKNAEERIGKMLERHRFES
jgi:hypothetical protein